jgi:serine/threonine protein phosphatase PrpC
MIGLPYQLWFVVLGLVLAGVATAWPRRRPLARSLPAQPMEAPAPVVEPAPAPALVVPEDEDVTRLNVAAPAASDSRVKVAYEHEAEEDEITSPLARILISAKGDSDRGHKRRANEDSLLFLPERSLFAVADGMGGYRGGAIASSLAVETLRQAFERESFVGQLRSEQAIPRRGHELASGVLQANWAVFKAARADPSLAQMGTTLVAARFSPNKQRVYIANVGDSRCYRLRKGKLRQLTTDQTMRLVGLQGPGANDLLQALGVTSDLAIDLLVDKPRPDDVYLLCSDGLSKMVPDLDIEQLLLREADLEAAVYGLIEAANDRGGKDNVTVVLVKVIERAVSAGRAYQGWSKLPDAAADDAGRTSEELTVIGAVSCDDPTTIFKRPPKPVAATSRRKN